MNPGPGAYDANDNIVKSGSKKAVIGASSRSKIIEINEADLKPGPGNYEY